MLYLRCMEIRQKITLGRHLVPELSQSLNILALPLLELRELLEKELEDNPLLEELEPQDILLEKRLKPPSSSLNGADFDLRISLITQKTSLQDILLRQLGMFTDTDEDFKIGQEIIGNIDENGYLNANIDEIAAILNVSIEKTQKILKLIQQFEPAGVAARTVRECLLIQLDLNNEKDQLIRKIIEFHLDDVAKKNYSLIAKALREPLENIKSCISKILRLDPKPGRNYSSEEIQRIIPDIIIDAKDEELEITISSESVPFAQINKTYRQMLKKPGLDPQTKEFLSQKLHNAQELLRAISKRQDTLRKIVEVVAEIQREAIAQNLSCLKPLTFKDVAQKIAMHESTVCRAIMNKYVKTHYGVVSLKSFFPSHIHGQDGEAISSNYIKRIIKETVEQEDKKRPLSDQKIAEIVSKENKLNLARRTVAKYREELRILPSSHRKER